jgi:hypothetical protein
MTKKEIKSLAIEMYTNGMRNKSEITRQICKGTDMPFDRTRMTISRIINKIASTASDPALIDECERIGINPENVKGYWYKSKHYSINVANKKDEFNYEDFKTDLISEISKWSPSYPVLNRFDYEDKHCMVFSPADIHIGKLCSAFETGEEYNSQIAVNRVMEGLHGVLKKSSGFDIDKIIFIAGNDILHIDTPKRTTTAGTPQDTDGMWYENFIMAKRLLVDIIETLVTVADVEVHFNPSNHDYMSGFMLFDSVSAWFRNHKQVEFFGDMSHRKYTTYGNNLIGMTHMDGAKVSDLPLLMAHEASAWWAECKHRYIYGHHVHHKTAKDYMSVCVETLRSPSGTDGWHHKAGYQYAPAAIEAFIHHKDQGQVARLTHIF